MESVSTMRLATGSAVRGNHFGLLSLGLCLGNFLSLDNNVLDKGLLLGGEVTGKIGVELGLFLLQLWK